MGYKALEQMNQVLTWYPKTQWNISVDLRTDAGGEYAPFVIVKLTNICTKQTIHLNSEGERLTRIKNSDYECAAVGYETSVDDLVEEIYVNIAKRRNERIK